MLAVVYGADVTGSNYGSLPKGLQYAGYVTGTAGVPWTAAQWAAHPGAIRIDQSPVNTVFNEDADVLDVETGAATFADCAPWAKAALANFRSGTRPGQRSPAIYCSQHNVTPVVNALTAGGVTGIGLWVANWNLSREAAAAALAYSTGPYPVIGYQYADAGAYDLDVWLESWVTDVSKKEGAIMQAPPGQWNDPQAWTWAQCIIVGKGLDGELHVFTFNPENGTWQETE